jgi:predicted DNA binding CopG/RHH family protein
MHKKVPEFKSDAELEAFLDQDLTDYLHRNNLRPLTFEFEPKEKQVNLRFSENLLEAVKKEAMQQGMSYHRYIRRAVEHSLSMDQRSTSHPAS